MSSRAVESSWLGQPAADYELFDAEGNPHYSSDNLGSWVWLVLHRHLG